MYFSCAINNITIHYLQYFAYNFPLCTNHKHCLIIMCELFLYFLNYSSSRKAILSRIAFHVAQTMSKKRGRMTDWTNSSDSAEGRSYCPEIVLYLDGKCGPKITRFRGLDFSFFNVWLVSEIGLRRIRRKTARCAVYTRL